MRCWSSRDVWATSRRGRMMDKIQGILAAALSVACTSLAWSIEPQAANLRLALAGHETGCAVFVGEVARSTRVCSGHTIPGSALVVVRVEADAVWLRTPKSSAGIPIDHRVQVGADFSISELMRIDVADVAVEVPLMTPPATQRSRNPASRAEKQ